MGKKACLAPDLDYDPWTDEYHDGDYDDLHGCFREETAGDVYGCGVGVFDLDGHALRASENKVPCAAFPSRKSSTCIRNDDDIKSFRALTLGTKKDQYHIPFTVAAPAKTITADTDTDTATANAAIKSSPNQILHYVPNPHRRPLFTDHIATHDGLLLQVASFLNMIEVLTLSIVSKILQTSLSVDGLYCSGCTSTEGDGDGQDQSSRGGGGILLPCLKLLSNRLLQLDPKRQRGNHNGTSGIFAYECLAFSKSCQEFASKVSLPSLSNIPNVFQPKQIMSINQNTSEQQQINAISFSHVRWEQSYYAMATAKGIMSPQSRKTILRSGLRLAYVTSESNNCALVTIWSGEHCNTPEQQCSTTNKTSSGTPSTQQQQYRKERYLPPNTKTILDAAIHSKMGLCCILATPLEHSSACILSMVALPRILSGANNKLSKQETKHTATTLKWQKHLSYSEWQLFSSSETQPIVSFSSQGTRVIFGSMERWGVVDVESGSRLWSVFDIIDKITTSSLHPRPSYPASANNNNQSLTTTTSSCTINAYLLHYEFLFLLENNGTRMRVYDVSNMSNREPLAEGNLPWSPKEKQAQSIVYQHRTYPQHKQLLQKEFQFSFCAGRVWITGMHNCDLLCSSSPRLLRRLRSRLTSISGRGNVLLSLRFSRMKSDLTLGVPHQMQTWNDSHLYVIDSDRLHCWRKSNVNTKICRNGSGRITTVVTAGNDVIEDVHVDRTKILLSTNCTYRNTTTRDWDGSGGIWVIPIDEFEPIDSTITSTCISASTTQWRGNPPKVELVQKRPYSPTLQIYHKRLFNVPNFASNPMNINNSLHSNHSYPISSSSNSNYQVIGIISDGRYLLVRCKKGGSSKTVILDLYSPA